MKERPILFSGPMVRAILDGRKTMTRRVVKPQPSEIDGQLRTASATMIAAIFGRLPTKEDEDAMKPVCPFGVPGDRLWVRETWRKTVGGKYAYKADDDWTHTTSPWKPSIHMPRAACRLTLEVVSVRVERLQVISNADAIAEGIERLDDGRWKHYQNPHYAFSPDPRESFGTLWRSISGEQSWDSNPWAWVVGFKVVKPETAGGF